MRRSHCVLEVQLARQHRSAAIEGFPMPGSLEVNEEDIALTPRTGHSLLSIPVKAATCALPRSGRANKPGAGFGLHSTIDCEGEVTLAYNTLGRRLKMLL